MRRIQRDSRREELIKQLTGGEFPPFKEIWRLVLFAASVGYHYDRREKLGNIESGKAFPSTYISNPAWPGFQYLMALVCTGEPHILAGTEESDDQRLTIFEEYANGGLAVLREELEQRSYSLDALLQFISVIEVAPTDVKLNDLEI